MNDMRLGDLDALYDHVMEEMRRNPHCGRIEKIMHRHEHESFLRDIRLAPTIDAVPVVRCWNCGNGLRSVDGYVRCSHPSGKLILMKGSDFCSYGEQRKEAEGDV